MHRPMTQLTITCTWTTPAGTTRIYSVATHWHDDDPPAMIEHERHYAFRRFERDFVHHLISTGEFYGSTIGTLSSEERPSTAIFPLHEHRVIA